MTHRSTLVLSVLALGAGALAFSAVGFGATEEARACCGKCGGGSGGHGGHGEGGGAPAQDGGSAGESAGKSEAAKSEGLLVDLGNAKCPIMGGAVDGKTWSEWNGLRIGHCCGMCIAKFAKDPQAALDAKKIEWKAAAAAVKKVGDAKSPEERTKALAALEKTWKVVRAAAATAPTAPAPAETGELLVDLGNAKCPIMGGAIDGKTWSEWNGLRIGHCCGMCPSKFAKDPQAALDAKKIEWKAAAAAVKKVASAKTPEERAKALETLKSKWTVVREPAAATPEPAPPK